MHARDLVQLASTIVANGAALVRCDPRLPNDGLAQYWSVSKCRHERWVTAIRRFSAQQAHGDASTGQWWAIRSVLEEILVSEVLTRAWTAVCCAHDESHGGEEFSPIVRNVLSTHLEARNRALGVLVYGHGLRVEEAVALNRIRRRNEQWADTLLGYLGQHAEVVEFAFNVNRVQEFSEEFRTNPASDIAWSLLATSLQASYQRTRLGPAANPDLNRKIAAAILSSLPERLFSESGVTNSLWLLRMQDVACDTQGMIEELVSLEEHATASQSAQDDAHHGRWWGKV